MNSKDAAKLYNNYLPRVQTFTVKGRLAYQHPIGHILRGFNIEPSAFSAETFYVNAFFLPLCVPSDIVYFSFGHRIGSNKRWSRAQSDQLRSCLEEESSFLLEVSTPRGALEKLLRIAVPNARGYINPFTLEALAYVAILANEITTAEAVMRDALARHEKSAERPEVAARISVVMAALKMDSNAAKEQLLLWEADTQRALGLS